MPVAGGADEMDRVLHVSELGHKVATAQQAVDAERLAASALKPFNPADLLGLTRTSLLARSASDADGGGSGGGGSSGDDPAAAIGARAFLACVAARAARGGSNDGNGGEVEAYVAPGVGPEILPPGSARPSSRLEHERVLRVARKVAAADFAAAEAAATGAAATGAVAAAAAAAASAEKGGRELETQLLAAKGHDPKMGFLKPHHPLHAYYQVHLPRAGHAGRV